MKSKISLTVLLLCGFLILLLSAGIPLHNVSPGSLSKSQAITKRYLYVAVPGIRDYLGFGGHGILVFDIDNNHRFVKRIPTQGYHPDKTPSNVKGIAVSLPLNSIFVSSFKDVDFF